MEKQTTNRVSINLKQYFDIVFAEEKEEKEEKEE